jgi:hypothetical protein
MTPEAQAGSSWRGIHRPRSGLRPGRATTPHWSVDHRISSVKGTHPNRAQHTLTGLRRVAANETGSEVDA